MQQSWRRAAERIREAEGLSSSPRLAEMFISSPSTRYNNRL